MKVKQIFSQRDKQWGNDRIGDTRWLMKDYGCLITSFAMVLNSRGWQIDPGILNELLKMNFGLNQDAEYIWGKVGKLYDMDESVINARERRVTKGEMKELKQNINREKLPILQVDFNSWTLPADMHFVVAEGVYKNDLIIADPWDGKRKQLLNAFGRDGKWDLERAIYRIVYLDSKDVCQSLQKEIEKKQNELHVLEARALKLEC